MYGTEFFWRVRYVVLSLNNVFKLDSKYPALKYSRQSVERCESLNTELYDCTEDECTIQEIYFSECRVGTTLRMLLDQKTNRQKNK